MQRALRLTFALSAFLPLGFTQLISLAAQGPVSPSAYLNDDSDWWSLIRTPDLSSASYGKIARSLTNFRILSINLRDGDLFGEARRTIGQAMETGRGDASTGRTQLCYRSNNNGQPVYLVFERGEVEYSLYLFSGGANWSGKDRCAKSALVTPNLKTASGLGLGATAEQVEKVLGKPASLKPDEWIYADQTDQRASATSLEKSRKANPSMTEKEIQDNYGTYTRSTEIVIRFSNGSSTYIGSLIAETF